MTGGAGLALLFAVRFTQIVGHVDDTTVRGAIEALGATVAAVWAGVAFWGWYLVTDGLERQNTNRRLGEQHQALQRIETVLAEMDREKEERTEKSRSFWNRRREGAWSPERRRTIDLTEGAAEQVSD